MEMFEDSRRVMFESLLSDTNRLYPYVNKLDQIVPWRPCLQDERIFAVHIGLLKYQSKNFFKRTFKIYSNILNRLIFILNFSNHRKSNGGMCIRFSVKKKFWIVCEMSARSTSTTMRSCLMFPSQRCTGILKTWKSRASSKRLRAGPSWVRGTASKATSTSA